MHQVNLYAAFIHLIKTVQVLLQVNFLVFVINFLRISIILNLNLVLSFLFIHCIYFILILVAITFIIIILFFH